MVSITNSDCLKLILCAINGDWPTIEAYIKTLDSKHNSRDFKALLAEVASAIAKAKATSPTN